MREKVICIVVSLSVIIGAGVTDVRAAQKERWPVDWDAGQVTQQQLPENWEGYVYVNPEHPDQRMSYRVILPDDYQTDVKYPLLVYLNEKQYRGNDNIAQLRGTCIANSLQKEEYQRKYPCIILVPQCPEGGGWVNGKISPYEYRMENTPISDHLLMLMDILDLVLEKWSVDKDRILLGGLDDGATGVWDLLARYPDKFAAAFPMGGVTDPTVAEKIKEIPIFAIHNYNDIEIPVYSTRNMVQALNTCGGNVFYYEFKNTKGGTYQIIYETPFFYDWLFSQTGARHKDTSSEGIQDQETGSSDGKLSVLKEMGLWETGALPPDQKVTCKQAVEAAFRIKQLKNANLQKVKGFWNWAKYLGIPVPGELVDWNQPFPLKLAGVVICSAMDYEWMDNTAQMGGLNEKDYYERALNLACAKGFLPHSVLSEDLNRPVTLEEIADALYRMIYFEDRLTYQGFDMEKEFAPEDVLLEGLWFALKPGRMIQNPGLERKPSYDILTEDYMDMVEQVRWCDLIADAAREAENSDVAIVPVDTAVRDFEKESMTVQDVFDAVSPSANMETAAMTGKELRSLLEGYSQQDFPCISGMRVTGTLTQGGKIEVKSVYIGASPLREEQLYHVTLVTAESQKRTDQIAEMLVRYIDEFSISIHALTQERLIVK